MNETLREHGVYIAAIAEAMACPGLTLIGLSCLISSSSALSNNYLDSLPRLSVDHGDAGAFEPIPDEQYSKDHPMAGWAGYKDKCWGGYLDNLKPSISEKGKPTDYCWGAEVYVAAIADLSWNLSKFKLHTSATRREALLAGFSGFGVAFVPPSLATAKNLPDSTGADLSKVGTVDALIPVISLRNSLIHIKAAVENDWQAVVKTKDATGEVPLEEMRFKAVFDAYSNPVSYKQKFVDQNAFLVYYSKGFDGPGRPSIESDLPEKQTLQYGARNEAWVSWDDFLAELDFARRNPSESSKEDLLSPIEKAIAAIDDYLKQAPVVDVEAASRTLAKR